MADLQAFKNQFKGDIVTPSDADYENAITRWAVNANRRSKIVAFVKDEADVALAIKYAKANALPIAIRGGGHNPAGASSIEGGLVIDLSRYINAVRVDAAKQLAYVGGGSLWETVDKEAIKHGLATVGGTVNHTGVGGLILGGGYGWLSPQHGLAIDNIAQATVVTADGSTITANENENNDLFFGIRGGGCNFGVVTEFVLKLHPQRRTIYAGQLIFPPPALERLVGLIAEWYPKAGENEAIFHILAIGPDGKPAIVVCPFYNGTEAEGRENFKAFFDLGPVVDMTKEFPYEALNSLQNPMLLHGQGRYFKGVSHNKIDAQKVVKMYEKVVEMSRENSGLSPTVLFEYFPLGKINSVPSGATAFRRSSDPSILIAMGWKGISEENTERARALVYEFIKISQGEKVEASQRLGYTNYDLDAEVPDKAKLVFENYPRLQAIKKRYDPENIFNKWFAISPA